MTRTTLAVLEAFLDAGADGQLYGLEIMHSAGIASGTLYPILDRLEDAEWIEGQWGPSEHPGRPARRSYHLTGTGITEASRAVATARQAHKRPRPNTGPVTA
ncbi:MAG TPA: helix-turn-helix transcriptional regulator [Jatrophihabitans sp.]|jgi:DNA-binding PadR family transcriptional regulator|uniref:PadR family transcriptional regulator n=1 Tax=Jatrophihabitans sp. TaxID=1932789 RepID=UPI002EE61F76